MPSAFIPSRLGYPAVSLEAQPVHQRSVHPGPLVLRAAPLKYPPPTPDRASAGCAVSFGLELIKALKGDDMAAKIAQQIVIR